MLASRMARRDFRKPTVWFAVLERLDVTLVPSTCGDRYHPFDQYVHPSAFYRNRPTDRWEFETGLRGGHRLKLGHRLLAAINRETGTGARDFVLHLDLVVVRIAL